MHQSTNIRTKKLKINNKVYIGFTILSIHEHKSLTDLIDDSFNNKGLTYFKKTDLPKAILEII
jgi:hypothetical protein